MVFSSLTATERDMGTVILRACALQTDPGSGDVEENLARAWETVTRTMDATSGIGVLVCPELGFSTYCLTSVERARACARWETAIVACAGRVARYLNAHVAVGHAREDSETKTVYNSQTVVDANGVARHVYDKSHLYCVDEEWGCGEGKGFETYELDLRCFAEDDRGVIGEVTRRVKCASAICMDINPYKFEAPWDAYELANACAGCELILFSSAWTNAHPDDDIEVKRAPIDFAETVTYWLARLRPLIGKREPNGTHFICANRIGVENDIQFTGCSCLVDLRSPPILRGAMEKREEGIASALIPLGGDDDDDDDDDLARRVFSFISTAVT